MSDFEVGVDNSTSAIQKLEQLRTTIAEQAKRIRHVEMALADTEALEMGTAETLGKAKARIKALERELGLAEVAIDEMSSAAIKQFKRIKELEDALRETMETLKCAAKGDGWIAPRWLQKSAEQSLAKINELIGE